MQKRFMMQIMYIQAVIFDRDNTLVAFDQAQMSRLERQITGIAPTLPNGAALHAWTGYTGPWPQHPADEPLFWKRFWSGIGEQHHLTALQVERLTHEVGALYHTCFVAFPDAAPTLHALHQADLRMAVLTNFELPSVDRTLAHADLNPALFEVTLTSSALGIMKPDPRAFRAAAAALNLPPTACAFVDDLAENVAAARSVGMRAYQIDRTLSSDDQAGGRISSLLSLMELLLPPSLRD
jgi:HAD superfamily hydrolase (TIGR01509 family)